MYLLYFILWIIFNGNFTLEICLLGLLIAAAIFAFTCRFMNYSIAKEKQLYMCSLRLLRYICVLIVEIVKANFAVIHLILSEKEEAEPVLVSFETELKTTTGRAFLANAITLTPGTITATLEDSRYQVHCLDESLAEGMDRSVFVNMLKGLESSGREDK